MIFFFEKFRYDKIFKSIIYVDIISHERIVYIELLNLYFSYLLQINGKFKIPSSTKYCLTTSAIHNSYYNLFRLV